MRMIESCFTLPVTIDCQINGAAGVDFNRTNYDLGQFEQALRQVLQAGALFVLPTVISDELPVLEDNLRHLDGLVECSALAQQMVLGYHLEGPLISPVDGYRGCHTVVSSTQDFMGWFDGLQKALRRPVRIVTLAPEVAGAAELIRPLSARGCVVAIGHSSADAARIDDFQALGGSLATHLGNGLPPLLSKRENPLFELLIRPELHASIIADGHHLSRSLLRLIVQAKGYDRLILVTDGTAASAAPPGRYTLGQVNIFRSESGVVRDDQTPGLAGSSATFVDLLHHFLQCVEPDLAQITAVSGMNACKLLNNAEISARVAGHEMTFERGADAVRLVSLRRHGQIVALG